MEPFFIDQTVYTGRPASCQGRLSKEIRVYDLLDSLQIPYSRVDHAAVDTIEACQDVDRILGIEICKNLFLCNAQKTKFYLLMMPGAKKFRTSLLSKQIQSSRLSFAGSEFMEEFLDITPGSVSVLGLMNDKENRVQLLIDRDVLAAGRLPAFEEEVCLAEICILRWNTENSWNSDTLFYAMKNMVDELFAACGCKTALAELAPQDYCCMVWGRTAPDAGSAAKQYGYLCSAFRLYFHGEAAVYLLSPVLVRDLPEAREKLTAAHADNIARRGVVQICRGESAAAGTRAAAGAFDSSEIARLLGQGLSAQAQAKLFGWLDQLLAEGKLDAAALRGFYQDFMQALYSIAEESGVDPKTLFDTAGAFELYRNATHSVEEMKTFLAYVCSQYEGLAGEEGSLRIVLKAEEYIKHNLEKNIRRDDVAAYAHVSAGYLSHLFSRERGCSLKEYIVRQKMLLARSLLRTTALPVSIVAMRVGYTNFSLFSQSYKAAFQCSPSAERKAMEQEPKL